MFNTEHANQQNTQKLDQIHIKVTQPIMKIKKCQNT